MASSELMARVGDVREPYRELLRAVRTRMRATRDGIERLLQMGDEIPPAEIYLDAADLMADLCLCHRSLEETGHAVIANGRLTDLLRRVSVFGMAPVTIMSIFRTAFS